MLIKELYKNKPVMSLEIFPPKSTSGIETVYKTLEELKNLKPDFISVTYGAARGGRSNTAKLASLIQNKYNIEALAHLTCIGLKEEEIDQILKDLKSKNIENILALRGDIPKGITEEGDYSHANELISKIKGEGNFSIGAACYPEGHIENTSKREDIKNLRLKILSGADFLITQMFFDNDLFYDFLEKLDLMGIHISVSAGIMPVINKKQIEKITSLCGASLPAKFKRILTRYENNPEALKSAGIAYATEQIIDLLAGGADGIHLYTMNRPEVARKIFKNIDSVRCSEEACNR